MAIAADVHVAIEVSLLAGSVYTAVRTAHNLQPFKHAALIACMMLALRDNDDNKLASSCSAVHTTNNTLIVRALCCTCCLELLYNP